MMLTQDTATIHTNTGPGLMGLLQLDDGHDDQMVLFIQTLLPPTPHFYEYEGVVGGDDEALLVTIHDAALATIEPRWCHSSHSSPLDTADGYFVTLYLYSEKLWRSIRRRY